MSEKPTDSACTVDAIRRDVQTDIPRAMGDAADTGASLLSSAMDAINAATALVGIPYRYQSSSEADPAKARAEINEVGSILSSVLGHQALDAHIERTQQSFNPGELLGAATGAAIGGVIATAKVTIRTVTHCLEGEDPVASVAGAITDRIKSR